VSLGGAKTVARTCVAVVAAAGALALCVAVFWLHLSFTPVLSGSMRPTFDPGSLIFTRQIPTADVRPGDIIVIVPPGETAPYAHRVETVTGPTDHPIVTTKGDANPAPDRWRAQLLASHTTEVIGSVPKVGLLIVTLHHRGWRVALLCLAGLAISVTGYRFIAGPRPTQRHVPAHRLTT